MEFASNIIITFTNKKKSNSWFSSNHVGDICIPALACYYEKEIDKDRKIDEEFKNQEMEEEKNKF